MANWYGSARSDHFRVHNEAAFLEWVGTLPGVSAEARDHDGAHEFCLLEEYGEGWPSYRCLDEPVTRTAPSGQTYEEYEEEIDLPGELSEHLAPGSVAVLYEIGAEKLRYLTGYAVAVNSDGERLCVDISDIYLKIAGAGWLRPGSREAETDAPS